MKVKCNREALFEAVQLAGSVVPARTPKPILQCAKIQADGKAKQLTIVASDGEITVKCTVNQVQVDDDGAVVLPADRIVGILRESQDDTVQLIGADSACEVVGQDSRFRVLGHEPGEFPEFEIAHDSTCFQVRRDMLKRMIHQVAFAASRESSRYALNGVLWEQKGKKLRMVATDGRRLAQVDGEVEAEGKNQEQTAIVPIKTMTLLERAGGDPDEKLEVSFAGNQVIISSSIVSLSGTLVQGRFPKYEDVIPAGSENKVDIQVDALQSAVRRAALLTNEQSRGVAFAFSKGKLRFTSSTPEMGEAQIDMSIDYGGTEVQIGFNPQYLLDMLRVVETDTVSFEFSDGKKPGLLRSGKNFLYVVMPVTV